MAIVNLELVYECFLKHSRMGTARMKQMKMKERKKREVIMERSKAGTKENRSPNGAKKARAYRPTQVRYAGKKWTNYLTYICNPCTAP